MSRAGKSSISILSQRTVVLVTLQEEQADERVNDYSTIVRQFRKLSNRVHKQTSTFKIVLNLQMTYIIIAHTYDFEQWDR